MLTGSRLKKLEELLSINRENKIILVIEDDYRFDNKLEEDKFISDMSQNSLVVEISKINVNSWRAKI